MLLTEGWLAFLSMISGYYIGLDWCLSGWVWGRETCIAFCDWVAMFDSGIERNISNHVVTCGELETPVEASVVYLDPILD